MPKKVSGEIKVHIVKNRQKNGDTYILERKTIYDPVKKFNKVLSTKLLSKIPKGSDMPVPTRPKRKDGSKTSNQAAVSSGLCASRMKTGMMDIIDHVGRVSGIDDAIYGSTDTGTAQKILSIARYLLATNGQPLPGITVWQYSHALPYCEGISEDTYHYLFERVGRDEALQQNFFISRCAHIKGRPVLAYDSTTISTYSGRLPEARRGFNKAGDGLNSIKLLTLYSIDSRQPVAFTKQPGNLPDVVTIGNALKQMSALGLGDAEIVTDNGYYSEQNMSDLLCAGFGFITLVRTGIKWVREVLDTHIGEFGSVSSACPFDTGTHGVGVMLMHGFSHIRKYANHRNGAVKGMDETFQRRIYLHLYFNPMRRVEEDTAFDRDMFELKGLLEGGTALEELSDEAQDKTSKYLYIRRYGGGVHVTFNEKACAERKKYHGYFALVSNCEKDTFECLRIYRRRETIESFFEAGKRKADGTRPRVWSSDALRGRMFIQFVALSYYEYINNAVREMKDVLAKENGEASHDLKGNLDMEAKLKSWLCNTPIYLILQWFDTVEEVKISSQLHSKRWSTEITQRDRMFMRKLGMSDNKIA